MNSKLDHVIGQARAEIKEEDFRAAVDAEKIKIRARSSFWSRIFPFTITISRRIN